ncbi:hypothetical protein LSH36_389g02025 [Paralvinella palmiformis]|uniref:Uncharacterized protein n=1 Tax=Paralvinella palmiformis TaxID=53620 RepID=A0AAD9N0C2_9ANNE|nr:hypothetical protein LSH36_389g02025 [Paralvinella palmiformis]
MKQPVGDELIPMDMPISHSQPLSPWHYKPCNRDMGNPDQRQPAKDGAEREPIAAETHPFVIEWESQDSAGNGLVSNQALYLINEAIPLLQLTISSSVRVLTAEDFRRTEEEEGIGFA